MNRVVIHLLLVFFCVLILGKSTFTLAQVAYHGVEKSNTRELGTGWMDDFIQSLHSPDTLLNPRLPVKKLDEPSRVESFYEQIERSARKNRITKEIYNIVLKSPPGKKNRDTLVTVLGIHQFLPYSFYHIRDINVLNLDPFGPSIQNPEQGARSRLVQFGNKLHVNTRESRIRKQLLFEAGDLLNPEKLADTERVLRSSPNIEDVSIRVISLGEWNDSVDIQVIVKDSWSKAFDIELKGWNNGRFNFWERNLFGIGHSVENNFYWSPEETGLGYHSFYRINNLHGKFLDVEGFISRRHGNEGYGVSLSRSLLVPDLKYAGGLSLLKQKTIRYLDYPSAKIGYYPISKEFADIWLARSFRLRKNSSFLYSARSIAIAGRYIQQYHEERPQVSAQTLYEFHNTRLTLLSLQYSTQRYYKTNLLYNFGRTEDIPTGYKIELLGGYEWNEFFDRHYAGVHLSFGNYFERAGYMFMQAGIGGFLRNSGYEQGVARVQAKYYSRLIVIHRWYIRELVTVNLVKGLNRFGDETVRLSNGEGIMGLSSEQFKGTNKLHTRLESNIFTPLSILDFKLVIFSQIDLGLISNDHSIFRSPLYTGIGGGIRLRNERLVFNTLQIRFSFYPNAPKDAVGQYIVLSGEQTLKPNHFRAQSPELLNFQ